MKYRGRVVGLFLNVSLTIASNMYFYFIGGYVHWKLTIISSLLLICLTWWLGLQYDKVQFFAEKDRLQSQELQKMNEELQRSNEKFQTIFEKAGMGIVLLDKKGKIVAANPKSQELFGYKEEELCTMTMVDVSYPDDHTAKNIKLLKELVEGKIDFYRLEKRYIRKDGQVIWGEVTSSLFQNNNNELPYVMGMMIDITERKAAEQKIQEANQRLEYLSHRDGLTGIANRRYLNKHFAREWERAVKNSTPLSLILLDIDYFKDYNDTYGHHSGDHCLKQVASVLEGTVKRQTDLVSRYGGEEFAIILPETDEKDAAIVEERLRSSIEALSIPHKGSKISQFVTASIGVASITPNSISKPVDLFLKADKALYQAKQEGRNQVVCTLSLLN